MAEDSDEDTEEEAIKLLQRLKVLRGDEPVDGDRRSLDELVTANTGDNNQGDSDDLDKLVTSNHADDDSTSSDVGVIVPVSPARHKRRKKRKKEKLKQDGVRGECDSTGDDSVVGNTDNRKTYDASVTSSDNCVTKAYNDVKHVEQNGETTQAAEDQKTSGNLEPQDAGTLTNPTDNSSRKLKKKRSCLKRRISWKGKSIFTIAAT